MTDIELLPLPEADDSVENRAQWPIVIDSDVWRQESVQDYARAVAEHNVSERDAQIAQLEKANEQLHAHGERMHAEIERLRQDVGTATRTHAITREHLEAAEARAERLLAEREVIAAEAVKYADKSGRLEAEIEALRAELDRVLGEHVRKRRALAKAGARAERLEEALRPFANLDLRPDGLDKRPDDQTIYARDRTAITVGDVRRAQAALRDQGASGESDG